MKLACAACPGFVEFVERGETGSDQVHVLAERLLAPLVDAEVDTLLLGCTHYPFLARTISDVMGHDVVLVDSADETAFRARGLLGELELARAGGPAAGCTASSPPVTSRCSAARPPAARARARPRRGRGVATDRSRCSVARAATRRRTAPAAATWCSDGAHQRRRRPRAGWLGNLQHHIGIDRIDAVVVSHAHPDHWVDLTGLHVALKYRYGREGMPV